MHDARLTDRRSHQNLIDRLVVFFLVHCDGMFDCGLFDFPIKSQTEKKEKKIHHIKARDSKYSTCFLVIHEK